MSHFLLIYNRRTGDVKIKASYPNSRRAEALRARFAEERLHRSEPDVEVVVLSGDSIEALERTHSRYFRSVSALVADAPMAI